MLVDWYMALLFHYTLRITSHWSFTPGSVGDLLYVPQYAVKKTMRAVQRTMKYLNLSKLFPFSFFYLHNIIKIHALTFITNTSKITKHFDANIWTAYRLISNIMTSPSGLLMIKLFVNILHCIWWLVSGSVRFRTNGRPAFPAPESRRFKLNAFSGIVACSYKFCLTNIWWARQRSVHCNFVIFDATHLFDRIVDLCLISYEFINILEKM